MNLQRTDPLTNTDFTARRANQVHLSAENRMKYWNNIYYKERKEKEKEFKALNKNYKILKDLLSDGKNKKVNRYYLDGRGFNFMYFTHQIVNGEQLVACYFNYSIEEAADPDFVLIKKIK